MFLKKPRKPSVNSGQKSKDLSRLKEIPEQLSRQTESTKTDEPQIDLKNGEIVCNFDFACILSTLAQKSVSNNVLDFNRSRYGQITKGVVFSLGKNLYLQCLVLPPLMIIKR